VGLEPVELDDQFGLSPRGVDLVSLDHRVDLRACEAVVTDEGEQAVLQLGSGWGWGAGSEEEGSEVLGAPAPWTTVEEGCGSGEAEDFGLVERPLEGLSWDDRGEVDEGSGRCRGGDAVMGGDLVGGENGTVRVDAWAWAEVPRRGDVDAGLAGAADAPEGGGRLMAQHRIGAAREDRRHPAAALRQHAVADRVHPEVKRVKPALGDSPVDRPPPESEVEQLPAGHDSVLPPREGRGDRVDFTSL
jgi:hypothetical protein